jgi:hypothetical protein
MTTSQADGAPRPVCLGRVSNGRLTAPAAKD